MNSKQLKKENRRTHKKSIVIFIIAIVEVAVFMAGYVIGSSTAVTNKFDSVSQSGQQNVAPEQIDLTEQENIPEQENNADENAASVEQDSQNTNTAIVEKIMADMTLSDMVYQMMFVTPEAITNVGTVIQAGQTTKKAIEEQPVGGIVYFAANFESREQTINMIKNTQSFSKIPLFISVDEEGGRVSRLGSNPQMNVQKQPPMKEIGDSKDPQKAYEVGVDLANDLKALGFNVDFAPDADVLINENNTEIGDRSFGTDPSMVAEMVKNVVKGMEQNGVSATLKHFPGHGSTYNNSHTGYSESQRTIDQLRNSEFLPFKSGIDAGVDFIMISHMTLVNATKEKVPSSVSKEVITDLLKNELGYDGIIITDSFSMGAVTDTYSPGAAAVKAVQAGADMILMTPDLAQAHNSIIKAVESGDISEERIRESVKKILLLKLKKNMFD